MKRIILMFSLIWTYAAWADDVRVQMLDAQIEQLTRERDEKYAALQKCEQTTKGFKIAGLATLVATGFGVYGNVKLAQKLNDDSSSSSSGSGGARLVDNRSQAEKDNDSCQVLCDVGAAPEECKC
ncbi:MAG: hypothetical protein J5608_02410 [Alphaproteobacteria bacterium]|nr:hypothetical protein [Alphaproteobacteria bacterium]